MIDRAALLASQRMIIQEHLEGTDDHRSRALFWDGIKNASAEELDALLIEERELANAARPRS